MQDYLKELKERKFRIEMTLEEWWHDIYKELNKEMTQPLKIDILKKILENKKPANELLEMINDYDGVNELLNKIG